MGIVGFALSVIGMMMGALLIIVGNLTTGYVYAYTLVEMASVPFYPVATPNFVVMWIGFIILGVPFIILGSASMHVREMTEKPSAFYAAGNPKHPVCSRFYCRRLSEHCRWPCDGRHTETCLMNQLREGSSLAGIYIIGFALILVAFILWALVFYSSRSQ